MNTSERPTEVELLPCPHCGGEAGVMGTVSGVWAHCSACESQIFDTEAEAIAAWNRRAALNSRNDGERPAEVERVWKAIISAWSKAKGPQGAPDMEWAEIAARAALNSRNDAPVAWRKWHTTFNRSYYPRWEYSTNNPGHPYGNDPDAEPLFAHPPEQSAAPVAWPRVWKDFEDIAMIRIGGKDYALSRVEEAVANMVQPAHPPEQSAAPAPWQPISTAPLDGTTILLRFGEDGVSTGWYRDNDDDPYPWKFLDRKDEDNPLANGMRDGSYGPSHWMPLPPGSNEPLPRSSPRLDAATVWRCIERLEELYDSGCYQYDEKATTDTLSVLRALTGGHND